jgi:signal transduction histidine kinase
LLASGQVELVTENVRKLRETAKDALGEMRMLIFELRPPILEAEGLAAALGIRLEAVEGRAGLKVELHVEGEERLQPEVEEGLYRIAVEALNNALRHAQAKCISVSLIFKPGGTLLEIADDGKGFDLDAVQALGGLGLQSMAERAEVIGGVLKIHSQVGHGTRIKVFLGDNKNEVA